MVHLVLIKFYWNLWWRDGKYQLHFFIINCGVVFFVVTDNEWGWTMTFPIFITVLDMFQIDNNNSKSQFFIVHGIQSVDSFYNKLIALTPIILVSGSNAYLILYIYKIQPNYL